GSVSHSAHRGGRRALPSFPTRRSSDLCSCRRSSTRLRLLCRRYGQMPIAAHWMRPRWPTSTVPCTNSGATSDAASVSHRKRWKRSEEHTSELQSRENLVCRLLLETKKH